MYILTQAASAVSDLVAHRLRKRGTTTPPRARHVIVDPWTISDTKHLVKLLTGSDKRMDVDTLSSRLERLFQTFPPTESTLQRLSMMQQAVAGTSGENEFCVILVFSIAMLCVPRKRTYKLKRSQSLPNRRRLS